jgi:hypothetical protein
MRYSYNGSKTCIPLRIQQKKCSWLGSTKINAPNVYDLSLKKFVVKRDMRLSLKKSDERKSET